MSATSIDLQPTSGNLFRFDGPAGTVVFLVALPLCLGIALASGAPLFAGVIAGIVGGMVVSLVSGSHVSVSGPAAGLTVIVANAIRDLGSFETFLTCVVLAGGIQIVFGLLRAGLVGDYVPNSVIKGLLAAIGIVIILKQIPHALGRDQDYEGDLSFFEVGSNNTLSDIYAAVVSFSPGALLIAATSLLVLVFWDRVAARGGRLLMFVPAPLLVVLLGIGLNEAFRIWSPALHLNQSEHMVSLPVFGNPGELMKQIVNPNWAAIGDPRVWKTAFTLAVVGSIETLLALEAADRLDPFKRISPTNRELFAQGIGNAVSGLIGGLPLTSVVVRTSANVYAGARTRMSSFIHGALLLLSALTIPGVLNRIPLSALAAILIVIGYKLTKAEIFRQQRRAGLAQFLPFLCTVGAIVFTDLLTGVLLGLAVGLFFVIQSNHHSPFTVVSQDNYYLMRFNKDATFVNKSALKAQLRSLPDGAQVIIDGTKALYIDHDIYELVADFSKAARYRNINVEYRNFLPQPKSN